MAHHTAAQASIAFVIRAWSVPTTIDLWIMAGLGLVWAGWMVFTALTMLTGLFILYLDRKVSQQRRSASIRVPVK